MMTDFINASKIIVIIFRNNVIKGNFDALQTLNRAPFLFFYAAWKKYAVYQCAYAEMCCINVMPNCYVWHRSTLNENSSENF